MTDPANLIARLQYASTHTTERQIRKGDYLADLIWEAADMIERLQDDVATRGKLVRTLQADADKWRKLWCENSSRLSPRIPSEPPSK